MRDKESKLNKNLNLQFYTILILFVLIGFLGFQVYQLNAKLKITNALLSRTFVQENASVKDISITSSKNDIVLGNETAPVELIVFTNYGCSFCKNFFMKDFDKINQNYIQNGIVKVVIRFMVNENNEKKLLAAKLAIEAYRNGKFESFNKVMDKYYSDADSSLLVQKAKEIGITDESIVHILSSELIHKQLLLDYKEAKLKGVKGTPSFVVDGKLHTGYKNYEFLSERIDEIHDEVMENCNE
jgi:protein-disulfide isomerase